MIEGGYLQPDPIGLDGGTNLYVYSSDNPMRLVDSLGLKPGDMFDSVFAAAIDAATYAWQVSKAEGVECGGWILKSGKCYTYDEPMRGRRRDIPGFPSVKPGNAANAWFHTHLPVTAADRYIGGARPEEFSDNDKAISDNNRSLGYLNFNGVIRVYFPK